MTSSTVMCWLVAVLGPIVYFGVYYFHYRIVFPKWCGYHSKKCLCDRCKKND